MNARAWQVQSLLLGYPDPVLLGRLDLLSAAASTLEAKVGVPLLRFIEHARDTPPVTLAADYVATFDQRKRCCLYLTYYAYGDTRNRGMALLKLKQTYAADGLILGDDELSDHLAVVLEYAAAMPERGRSVMNDHRAGLELLRLALHDMRSPWVDVLESVSATLPPLRSMSEVAKLAAQGPPEEKVGTYR
ncbi:nitrate reductase molybdenum cofactor assembly chaperone [Actinoplanes sp. NPDC000266]